MQYIYGDKSKHSLHINNTVKINETKAKMYCHDLEVMSSNPGRVELGMRSTSVLSRT